jgi:flagellar protein FliO/FliZ
MLLKTRPIGRLCLPAAAAWAPLAHAQASGAAHGIEGPSPVPMAVALLIVLALIGVAAWVFKRAGVAPRAGAAGMRVVSQLALGPRERVVVVEIGERWWLLGVGTGGITRLGTLPKGDAATPAGPMLPQAVSFASLLGKLRGGVK